MSAERTPGIDTIPTRQQSCPICGKPLDTYWPVDTCSPDCDREMDKRDAARPVARVPRLLRGASRSAKYLDSRTEVPNIATSAAMLRTAAEEIERLKTERDEAVAMLVKIRTERDNYRELANEMKIITKRTVISAPGAAVQVVELELTDEARAGLCIGRATLGSVR